MDKVNDVLHILQVIMQIIGVLCTVILPKLLSMGKQMLTDWQEIRAAYDQVIGKVQSIDNTQTQNNTWTAENYTKLKTLEGTLQTVLGTVNNVAQQQVPASFLAAAFQNQQPAAPSSKPLGNDGEWVHEPPASEGDETI